MPALGGIVCSASRISKNWLSILTFTAFAMTLSASLGPWITTEVNNRDFHETLLTVANLSTNEVSSKMNSAFAGGVSATIASIVLVYAETLGKPDDDSSKSSISVRLAALIYFIAAMSSGVCLGIFTANYKEALGITDATVYSRGWGWGMMIAACIYYSLVSAMYLFIAVRKYYDSISEWGSRAKNRTYTKI